MTVLLTSGSNHTIPLSGLRRTHCPPQAGRGQPKRPQADGESNKAKQDNYPLDRQRGIPWGGGVRGVWQPYIYIYIFFFIIYIYSVPRPLPAAEVLEVILVVFNFCARVSLTWTLPTPGLKQR